LHQQGGQIMNVLRITQWYFVAAVVTVGMAFGLNQPSAAQNVTSGQDGMEVLTRGPVHEAFAETVSFDPKPGIVIQKAPPEPIDELTPDQRPEGANMSWIPGYWGWDDERNDFLWVSGVWRALPPGRQWLPGYWAQTEQGNQWTSGYWADANASEVQYLPEPPATVEAGPNTAAPSADDTWIPGSWVWQDNRYAWRAGSWAAGQQDWQWVPAYYVSTPRGYVFNDGYWDYPVASRGVMFAPVYFSGSGYRQSGFSYSPSTVINPAVFANYLFLRPSYGHYYFGDYYAPSYANAGFSPGFTFQSGRLGYDPFFAQQRWENRQDRDWANRTEQNFRNFRDNENARPPRTMAAQTTLNANAATSATSGNKAVVLGASLDALSKSTNSPVRFQPVDKAEQQQFGKQRQESRKFLAQRQQLEASAANLSAGGAGQASGPQAAKLLRSPFVGASVDRPGQNDASAVRHEVLKPNLQAEPQRNKVGDDADVMLGKPQASDNALLQDQPNRKDGNKAQDDSKRRRELGSKHQPPDQTGGLGQGGPDGKKQTDANGSQQVGPKEPKKDSFKGQQPRATGGQKPGARKNEPQGGADDKNKAGANGPQQGGSKDLKSGGANGPPHPGPKDPKQGATNGPQQGPSQNQPANDSKKQNKDKDDKDKK
jgi:WXXGXW repeat (2 copies)